MPGRGGEDVHHQMICRLPGPTLRRALLPCLALACRGAPTSGDSATAPTVTELEIVVPGAGLPMEVQPQDANNNLDVVEHEGDVYLAFRTAPTHFASGGAVLYVVRSSDQQSWSYEAAFTQGTDLREPRLLSWQGELFLYFAVLGDNPLAFEPQGTMLSVRGADGSWSEAEWLFEDDFVPWRTRIMNGVPTMLGYTGGGDIYATDEDSGAGSLPALEVKWLQSEDGRSWVPAVNEADGGVVSSGGGSETDMAFLPDGRLIAVIRNEAGDELGWGSKVCRAEADAPGDWTCVGDPRKYDSPLVFEDGAR